MIPAMLKSFKRDTNSTDLKASIAGLDQRHSAAAFTGTVTGVLFDG
jgi:hypothetical protein